MRGHIGALHLRQIGRAVLQIDAQVVESRGLADAAGGQLTPADLRGRQPVRVFHDERIDGAEKPPTAPRCPPAHQRFRP